ncbi:MAG: hypothetical protein ACYTG5_04465 [Planctomycetota bacterium]|jgi:hypothetical protein
MIQEGLILLSLFAEGIAIQDPTGLEAAYRELHSRLEPARKETQRPRRSEQLRLIRDFLAEYGESEDLAGTEEVLKARTRLASLLLCDFELIAAGREFNLVLSESAPDDRDLRPRALYGLAQVQEMRQQPKEAGETLRRIELRYEGTRYATYAKAALLRLENSDENIVGRTAPTFSPRLDISGKARDLNSLAGKAALLIFWSPEHEAGLRELRKLVRVARRAGLSSEQILAFGMQTDPQQQLQRAETEGWKMPQIALSSDFLDPIVLAYRVRSLPTSCLIAPDGTLLARNLSPARLAKALDELR